MKIGKDVALVERMIALSIENPRYGYRRVWALLGREGWAVNKKRVQRLWSEVGLKVPASRVRKRRRFAGTSENGCASRRAEHINHVWSYDFAIDATEDGRRLKVMPVVDEYSSPSHPHQVPCSPEHHLASDRRDEGPRPGGQPRGFGQGACRVFEKPGNAIV